MLSIRSFWKSGGAVTAGVALMALAATAPAELPDVPLETLHDGAKESLKEFSEYPFVAVHFYGDSRPQRIRGNIVEFEEREDELAGIEHLYVVREGDRDEKTRELLKPLSAQPEYPIFVDVGDYLAKQFEAQNSINPPGLILMDNEGEVVFRQDRTPKTMVHFGEFERMVRNETVSERIRDFNLTEEGVALEGYDPVVYFKNEQAKQGREDIASFYRGATFRFIDEETRSTFADSPEEYLPAYGGWGATAMARGERIVPNPEDFLIRNGNLFLFSDTLRTNPKRAWLENMEALADDAKEEWQEFVRE